MVVLIILPGIASDVNLEQHGNLTTSLGAFLLVIHRTLL
jgi:hypothetical protein